MSIFKLHDTYGVPIEIIAEQADIEGLAIDWKIWMKEAISAGWKYEKISKTITHINDFLYGNNWHRFKYLIPKMYLDMVGEENE